MEWTPGGDSSDIEDRRDESGGGGGGGFGLGPVHLGIGGTLVVGALSLLFHQNLFSLFNSGGSSASSPYSQTQAPPGMRDPSAVNHSPGEEREKALVQTIVGDVRATWTRVLPEQAHRQYRPAHLVLYRDETESGCGEAQSATGPFYCPEDEKVYLDMGFFQELKTRFGAPGEFAQAYVIAHEYGHHIQKILGIEAQVRHLQESNPRAANALSVELELQADCYAGIWAKQPHTANIVLDQNDIAAGLNAAAAVGDDRLQRMAGRRVSPESFTHGSSAQRTHWFQQGYETGELSGCNTGRTSQ